MVSQLSSSTNTFKTVDNMGFGPSVYSTTDQAIPFGREVLTSITIELEVANNAGNVVL